MSDRVGRRVYSLLRAHAPDALQIHEHNSNSGSALVKGSEFVPSKDELARRLKAEPIRPVMKLRIASVALWRGNI